MENCRSGVFSVALEEAKINLNIARMVEDLLLKSGLAQEPLARKSGLT